MAKRKLSKRLERQAAAYQKLNLRKLDASEWDDELHRCIVANQVLQISGSQNALVNDASVKAAFDAFALNPANPRHWKMLLHIFASEHFRTAPTKRKRGAGVKWTKQRQEMLARHHRQLEQWRTRNGKKWRSNFHAANVIRDLFPDQYSNISVGEMGRHIAEIRKKRAI
jgi:hypothetical protein